jgi:hypothetical protein
MQKMPLQDRKRTEHVTLNRVEMQFPRLRDGDRCLYRHGFSLEKQNMALSSRSRGAL